jgi:hypothetical protein
MKKLIAIAVVFALIAGTAFAQTSISGTVDLRMDLLNGNFDENNVPTIGGPGVADGYVQLSGTNGEANFGGLVRIKANPMVSDDGRGDGGKNHGLFHRAFAWWKPIPQLRIFLGQDKDGMFSTGGTLTDWAFHQGGENYLNRHDWDYWRAIFPGNWDSFGLAFTLNVEALEVNLVIPTGAVNSWPLDNWSTKITWEAFFPSLRLQVNYSIPGFGRIYFSWIGPAQNNNVPFEDIGDGQSFGNIAASLLITAVEGLPIQVGFATDIVNGENTTNRPLHVGLAAHYTGGDWGVKFRFGSQWGGMGANSFWGATYQYQPVNGNNACVKGNAMTFNVMPWFNLSVMRVFVDLGAYITMPDQGDGIFGFWVNPYIRKSFGSGALNAGIRIENNGTDVDSATTFSVPLQFTYSF